MPHPTTRTERRQTKRKSAARVRRNWNLDRDCTLGRMTPEEADDLARRFADNRCPCSTCCGNPRRRTGHFKAGEEAAREAEKSDNP
jgi:hypothetical protein